MVELLEGLLVLKCSGGKRNPPAPWRQTRLNRLIAPEPCYIPSAGTSDHTERNSTKPMPFEPEPEHRRNPRAPGPATRATNLEYIAIPGPGKNVYTIVGRNFGLQRGRDRGIKKLCSFYVLYKKKKCPPRFRPNWIIDRGPSETRGSFNKRSLPAGGTSPLNSTRSDLINREIGNDPRWLVTVASRAKSPCRDNSPLVSLEPQHRCRKTEGQVFFFFCGQGFDFELWRQLTRPGDIPLPF